MKCTILKSTKCTNTMRKYSCCPIKQIDFNQTLLSDIVEDTHEVAIHIWKKNNSIPHKSKERKHLKTITGGG
jgi:hypothetical protein